MKIENILAKKGPSVFTIHPAKSLREALAVLAERNVGALVVTDDAGTPIGILSERDIVRLASKREDIFDQPIIQVMTKDLITGMPQDDLRSVLHTMTQGRFRHLPILERGKLVGLVSIGDLVQAQLDEDAGVIETLQAQIIEGEK